MADVATDAVAGPPSTRIVCWTIRVLGLFSSGVAGYLFFLSWSTQDLPLGCGAGSGCSEVLNSRWSRVFGVPVSGPALLTYLGILATTLFIGPRRPRPVQQIAWSILVALSATVVLSAVWFVGLQVIVIRAVCYWCLAGHLLGLSIAAVVFLSVLLSWKPQGEPHSDAPQVLGGGRAFACGGAAVLLVGGFAVAQIFGSYQGRPVDRLPAGENADTGPGEDRLISVVNGDLQFAAHEVPTLGSPDAGTLVVILFDYCCPHCRRAHEYLLNGIERYGDQMGVVLLPMPLNRHCNPYWEDDEPRFEHSCELAELALAVWRADRDAFGRFDAWLFEPDTPRNPDDAKKRAEELVTAAALANALADDWIGRQIQTDVEAFHASGAERIPLIMSPGIASVVGRPESETQLFELLEQELGLDPIPR